MKIPLAINNLLLCLMIIFSNNTFAGIYGNVLCKTKGFHCVKVKKNQTWRSLFPNAEERDIVMRLNRMNTGLYAGLRIGVPDNLATATLMDFSPFPKKVYPPQEKLVVIDPVQLAFGAYDAEGNLIRWGPISAGAEWCEDIEEPCFTHAGSYRIYSLGSSDCISRKFPLPNGGAPMPYCSYFNKGQALHGEPNGLPGFNASHGCVRLFVNDAEWLRYTFLAGPNASNNYRGTRIIVGDYGETTIEQGYVDEQPDDSYESDAYY